MDPRIALLAEVLGAEFPPDPADRIIAATAKLLGATLVSKDRRLRTALNGACVW